VAPFDDELPAADEIGGGSHADAISPTSAGAVNPTGSRRFEWASPES
jgi:hypothetical protein